MSDGGMVSAEVNGFTVTTNSGISEAQLRANLKPKADEAASNAGKELGKRGGEASAKAKAEAKAVEEDNSSAAGADKLAPEKEPEPKEAKAEEPKPEEKAEAKSEGEAEPESEKESEPEKEPEPEKPKPNPRHDPKARMLEATRKEAEAKRALAQERERAAALEARLAALESGEKPAAPKEPAPKQEHAQKPTPDGFETYEDYLDARDAYNRAQWEEESRQRQRMSAAEHALSAQIKKFSDATKPYLERFSEEIKTLKSEFQLAEGERPTGENWLVNELIFSPETAPTLMLHLTEHPEDLQRIAALTTPRAVSREMAKLEARLEAVTAGDSSEREVEVSRAAPPVRPVAGKPYVTESNEYRPGMTLDQYAKVWRKQHSSR